MSSTSIFKLIFSFVRLFFWKTEAVSGGISCCVVHFNVETLSENLSWQLSASRLSCIKNLLQKPPFLPVIQLNTVHYIVIVSYSQLPRSTKYQRMQVSAAASTLFFLKSGLLCVE